MKSRITLALATGLLSALAVIGCQREPALRIEVPDHLTLYSIDGRDREIDGRDPKAVQAPGKMFHGYPIVGQVAIEDPKRRETLIAAFKKGIAQSDGAMAKCFWPRHAFRLEKDGKVTDYVICFHCFQFVTYQGDRSETKAIDETPQPVFNEELKRAGISLVP